MIAYSKITYGSKFVVNAAIIFPEKIGIKTFDAA